MKKFRFLIYVLALVLLFSQCTDRKVIEGTLVAVALKGDKYGYIDPDGNWLIQPQYDIAGQFSNGLAYVESNDSAYFIDISNKIQLNLHPVKNIPYFYNGVAVVELSRGNNACINKEGEVLFQNFSKLGNYVDGLMQAMIQEGGKKTYGYVDIDGQWKISFPNNNAISVFSEGLAAVRFDNQLWGYINNEAQIIIHPAYQFAGEFHEGLAAVLVETNRWGFINKEGKMVIPATYVTATRFSEGYSIAMKDDFLRRFIDSTGETISIDSVYANYNGGTYNSGLAPLYVNGKTAFLNEDSELEFEVNGEAGDFHNAYSLFKVNDQYGFIDPTGEIIVTPQFERLGEMVDSEANNEFWVY